MSGRRHRDAAVSVVIGSLIVLALVTTMMAAYRLSWVPQMEEDREVARMVEVEDDMDRMLVLIDRLTDREAVRNLTMRFPVGLEPSAFPRLQGNAHQLDFLDGAAVRTTANLQATGGGSGGGGGTSGASGLAFDTSTALVLERDGRDFTGVEEGFTELTGTDSVVNVSSINDLRVRLEAVNGDYDNDNVTITVKDANGNMAARLVITIEEDSSEALIFVKTLNATGGVLFNQPIPFHATETVSPVWIDVLEPNYRFQKLIRAAKQPLDISLVEANNGDNAKELSTALTAEYAISITEYQADETLRVASQQSAGIGEANLGIGYNTDHIVYRARNPNYVDQNLWIDNGALVLEQGGTALFRSEPRITVGKVGANITFTFTLPGLNATSPGFVAQESLDVRFRQVNASNIKAWMEQPSVNLTTPFPSLWGSWLNQTFADKAIPSSWYDVTVGTGWVKVDLIGNQSVGQTYHTLFTFNYAQIQVEVVR